MPAAATTKRVGRAQELELFRQRTSPAKRVRERAHVALRAKRAQKKNQQQHKQRQNEAKRCTRAAAAMAAAATKTARTRTKQKRAARRRCRSQSQQVYAIQTNTWSSDSAVGATKRSGPLSLALSLTDMLSLCVLPSCVRVRICACMCACDCELALMWLLSQSLPMLLLLLLLLPTRNPIRKSFVRCCAHTNAGHYMRVCTSACACMCVCVSVPACLCVLRILAWPPTLTLTAAPALTRLQHCKRTFGCRCHCLCLCLPLSLAHSLLFGCVRPILRHIFA